MTMAPWHAEVARYDRQYRGAYGAYNFRPRDVQYPPPEAGPADGLIVAAQLATMFLIFLLWWFGK